jgi:hypothetical protein
MKNVIKSALVTLLLGCLVAGVSGCRKEGPAERAGREIDEATEKAGKEIGKAGKEFGKAGEKMMDALKDLKK